MKYAHIISEVVSTPWAMREDKLRSIMAFLTVKAKGGSISQEEIELVTAAKREPYLVACGDPEVSSNEEGVVGEGGPALRILPVTEFASAEELAQMAAADPSNASRSRAGAIAVLPVTGTIAHRMGMMNEISGGTSTERVAGWLRTALADPMVHSIVLDVDSPGGTVPGVMELGDEIFSGRQTKPIVAVANAQAASAAYWLASQASEFVVIPSGEVGSIGVFAAHEDISEAAAAQGVKVSFISAGKYKTEGNSFEPLSEEARAALQGKVNDTYNLFTAAVARGRGVTQQKVKDDFGQGRMLAAKQALAQGMVDRVATLERTLQRLGAKPKQTLPMPDRMKAEAGPIAEVAESAAKGAAVVANQSRQREMQLFDPTF